MKNLVLYGTTYGYAESCAKALAQKLDGSTECININKSGGINFSAYDTVVIGSSVYMGQMNKGIKDILSAQAENLKNKRLAFFVCCGFPEMSDKHFENNIPKVLLDKALCKESFGGQMDISKMGFFHKLITKMVKKAGEKEGRKDPVPLFENIDKMSQQLNKR